MLPDKKEHRQEKLDLHPRNKHRERYDFNALVSTYPGLAPFVRVNEYGDESVDFSKPEAVMMLNSALLKHFYGIENWHIPSGYLCPPVPGRADYIHHIADLLRSSNHGIIPRGNQIKCLDIGVGANCIYPIIGNREYGWSFVGSDVAPVAVKSATAIAVTNESLKGHIEIRLQPNAHDIFLHIIRKHELFDLTLCNPPFHASLEEAQSGTLRKLNNLNQKRVSKPTLNFGGKHHELWCEGGEEIFVQNMINQSRQVSSSCFWFSTLISKQAHLKSAYRSLKFVEAVDIKTIPMRHGNKISRIVAWTYLTPEQQKRWIDTRWSGSV